MPATRSSANNADGIAFEAVAVTLEVSKGVQKTIVREIIQVKSVEAKIIKKDIAYLRLKAFNSTVVSN